MERQKTGIKNFDSMINGGIPSGSIFALSGPPGVGKSIFTLHFLLEGARNKQKSIYINLEEPRANIDNALNQLSFGEEFYKYEKKGLITIKCMEYPEYERIYPDLMKKIKEDDKIKRIAIDSFNCFFTSVQNPHHFNIGSEINIRKMITSMFSNLRRKNLTTMLILEATLNTANSFYYNIPYLVDGLVNLDFISLGSLERRIFVPKMRWTSQYDSTKPFDITNKGIVIREESEEI
jgi:KaiC/GvpD/RAD55 family RecA-like ATPase